MRAGEVWGSASVSRDGRAVSVNRIDFSTLDSLPRDVQASEKVLLHDWQQDKTKFATQCIRNAKSPATIPSIIATPELPTAHCCRFGYFRANRRYCPIHTPLDTPRGYKRYFAAEMVGWELVLATHARFRQPRRIANAAR